MKVVLTLRVDTLGLDSYEKDSVLEGLASMDAEQALAEVIGDTTGIVVDSVTITDYRRSR